MKSKLIVLMVFMSFFACEKPQPQKPRVISTHIIYDTIDVMKMDSLQENLPIDSARIPQDSLNF